MESLFTLEWIHPAWTTQIRMAPQTVTN